MPDQPAPTVSLCSALSTDDAWLEVIRPWFERATARARTGERECVVVVPSRGLALALKNRALQEGLSLLGIRFWLPGELREALISSLELKVEVPERNALTLLTVTVAEEAAMNASNEAAG